jgi:hypothetical protein
LTEESDPAARVNENVDELRQSIAGAVIGHEDAGYDAARRCFNALVDRRPGAIVRCRNPTDVATAFDFARSQGVEVAVRGGGHSPAGHCVLDGGLVIDLSLMRRVEVDVDARLARSEGGATWLDFDSATQAFGLVTPGGVVGTTGVAGLTFGGGIGHLTAQHGLTCDNLLGAELVTPDGKFVRASGDENAELLWGLRGGGGNSGVATRLEFRLHPLDRMVGGRLTYAGSGVVDALRRFRDVVGRAPRVFSCGALLEVDEESLMPILIVSPCYTGLGGDSDELRELRSAPGLVTDGVRSHSFLAQQHVFNPPYGEDRAYWKGNFVRELPDELIDELLARMVALGRDPGQILIRVPARGGQRRRPGGWGGWVSPRRVQHQRDGGMAGTRPRPRVHLVDTADGGGDRTVLVSRGRLCQLHAGGRTDRARARVLRRPSVRATSRAEATIRPGQRPTPKSEHPAL